MKKLLTVIFIITVLALTGCSTNTATQEAKLISSEDYPDYKTVSILNWFGEDRFDINIVSWEFVNEDMIHIKGIKKIKMNGIPDKQNEYDFLIDKSNVIFYTILKVELD